MSIYNELRRNNIFCYLKRLFYEGKATWDREDPTKMRILTSPSFVSPWHYTEVKPGNELEETQNCYLWKHVLYDYILKGSCVPSNCHRCWKLVVVPETVQELFALDALMAELGYPSKCGGELRGTTPRSWGGYFYHNTKEAGQARYKEIKALLEAHPILKWSTWDDDHLFLKRGCTEYETANIMGGTDKWYITDDQLHVERMFFDFVVCEANYNQPPQVVTDIKQQWLDHAAATGDRTANLFNDGQPIIKKILTYHE